MMETHWKNKDKVNHFVQSAQKRISSKYEPFAELILTKMEKHDLNENSAILDLGCGPGFLLFELKSKSHQLKIYGLDPSKQMLNAAREKAREYNITDYTLKTGIAEDIPFSNDFFEAVSCLSSLHDFSDPLKTIQEVFRVLKTNGIFVLKDRNRSYPRWKLFFQFFKLMYWAGIKGAIKHIKSRSRWLNPSEVISWMEDEGFEVELLEDRLEYIIMGIK